MKNREKRGYDYWAQVFRSTLNLVKIIETVFLQHYLLFIFQLWIGGLVSAAVVVLVVSAYVFSNGYLHQYPIERVTGDSSFACDVTMRNAKFSTTIQMISNSRSSTKDNQAMFDMLKSQPLTLNI